MPIKFSLPFWVWGWLLLAAGMLAVRTVIPIDETRYLSVAWEMWWRHSQWVPYLNGHTYDGKPPLLFWLMELGWMVFGVSAWWARLVAPLFGLLALFITQRIARRLWPDGSAAVLAPTILLGAFYWAVFSSATMFDMLLNAFALLAVYGLIRVWQGGSDRYFWLTGLGLGLGILAKGPVVFLPVAAVGLTARWWMKDTRPATLSWRRWYTGLLLALGVSVAVALLWLIPMAIQGGWHYFIDMTWHQTAGYTVHSFSHRRPWWWYLPLLPVLLFPWSLWPDGWRASGRMARRLDLAEVRLCLAWSIPVLILFSLISGKQPHYLLPIFPPLALLLARGLSVYEPKTARFPLPGLVFLGLAGLWFAVPFSSHLAHTLAWPVHVPLIFAGALASALAVIGVTLLAWSGRLATAQRVRVLAAATWVMLLIMAGGLFRASWPAYDVRPASAFIRNLAAVGAPVAISDSSYQGEFNFFARIKAPITEVRGPALLDWARAHPDGYVIAYVTLANWNRNAPPAPLYRQLYRGEGMGVWSARQLVADPGLVQRFD